MVFVWNVHRTASRENAKLFVTREAMRLAANLGCTVYDLWGAPDVFNDTDSMWGVYRFKEGLGGEVVRTLGAWDYSPLPILYALYIKIIPLVTSVMRMLGKKQTAAQLEK